MQLCFAHSILNGAIQAAAFPVLRAQIGDCKFRSAKNNLQGSKKRMRNIRTDVGKKKFIVCVMDDKEKILEETAYDNTLANAKEFAG